MSALAGEGRLGLGVHGVYAAVGRVALAGIARVVDLNTTAPALTAQKKNENCSNFELTTEAIDVILNIPDSAHLRQSG